MSAAESSSSHPRLSWRGTGHPLLHRGGRSHTAHSSATAQAVAKSKESLQPRLEGEPRRGRTAPTLQSQCSHPSPNQSRRLPRLSTSEPQLRDHELEHHAGKPAPGAHSTGIFLLGSALSPAGGGVQKVKGCHLRRAL